MSEELVARIDAALLDGVSRGEFVRRAVELALSVGADQKRRVELFGPRSDNASLPVARAETWDEALPPGHPARVEPAEQPRRHAANCKCPVCS